MIKTRIRTFLLKATFSAVLPSSIIPTPHKWMLFSHIWLTLLISPHFWNYRSGPQTCNSPAGGPAWNHQGPCLLAPHSCKLHPSLTLRLEFSLTNIQWALSEHGSDIRRFNQPGSANLVAHDLRLVESVDWEHKYRSADMEGRLGDFSILRCGYSTSPGTHPTPPPASPNCPQWEATVSVKSLEALITPHRNRSPNLTPDLPRCIFPAYLIRLSAPQTRVWYSLVISVTPVLHRHNSKQIFFTLCSTSLWNCTLLSPNSNTTSVDPTRTSAPNSLLHVCWYLKWSLY